GPCRTKFGYHIVNVIDRRPAAGKIVVAHIMINSPIGAPAQDSINAKAKADEIYAKVLAGEDFATLARQFSNDKQSAVVGGEIPKFGLYEMPQTFERAAFSLAADGDVAAPVKTAWGWHIIKRIRKEPFPTYDQAKSEIKQRVSRDQRAMQGRVSLIARVKSENGFQEFPATVKEFYSVVDSTYYLGRWSAGKAAGMNKTMFVLAGKAYTQQDFAKWLELHQVRGARHEIPSTVDAAYKNWVEDACVQYEDSQLEVKYPDFRNLMQEYRDGMLLFDLMDKKVWSKAVRDTAGLRAYHEANKAKYQLPERSDATVYSCKDEATAKQVRSLLKQKKTTKQILDSLNKQSQLNVTAEHKMWVKGENSIVDKNWKKGTSKKNEMKDGRVMFVVVDKIDPARAKTLQEARGAVTTDYQNQLDKEWIAELKAKYPVTVNRDVLKMVK
ncbi:MAG TPA: peptidylprolyl isomerase, partial [Bacteroidia bacterium]|nr:peptidylprolyl isomerase [Bacteroidia bacterium]